MEGYGQAIVDFSTWNDAIGAQVARVQLYVPKTMELMHRGLQGFEIEGDQGMLFPSSHWPQPEPIAMWLASVHYPLAIMWVGPQGTITHIEKHVAPGNKKTYTHNASAVIEVRAETAAELGLKVGSFAIITITTPMKMPR